VPQAKSDKLLLITGGSRGLGKALVEQYRVAGWRVIEWSRSGAGPDHRDANWRALEVSPPRLDLEMSELSAQEWAEAVGINNAAQIEPVGYAGTLDDSELVAALNLNFTAGIRFMAAFLRHFGPRHGRRILANISSGAATRPIPGWAAYCAAKSGTEHFIRTAAAEENERANPVFCVNINPGVMDTGMQASIRATPGARFPLVQRFLDLHQSGQLRQAADIARRTREILAGPLQNGETCDATR